MIQRLAIISGLILSTTCAILPLIPIQVPVILQLQHLAPQQPQQPQNSEDSNYNFAYNVNDERTGDIKSQQETKSGGTTIGQYSLVQPDGIRRTVDYRADDQRGFRAQINNEIISRPLYDNRDDPRSAVPWPQSDLDQGSQWPQSNIPQWSQNRQNGTPQPQQDGPNAPPMSPNEAAVLAQWQQIIPNDAAQWQQDPDVSPQSAPQWQQNPDVSPQSAPQSPQNNQNTAPQRPQNNQDGSNDARPAPAAVSRTSIVQTIQTRRIVHPPLNPQNQWD